MWPAEIELADEFIKSKHERRMWRQMLAGDSHTKNSSETRGEGAAGNLRNGHVITSTIIMTPSLHQQITCPQVELETNLREVSTEKSPVRLE